MTEEMNVDISLNQTRQEERTFIGEVVIDAVEPAKAYEGDSGPQYQFHLGVKPLSFALRSDTGAFHNWPRIKYSNKTGELIRTGEFGRVVGAIRDVFKAELTRRGIELRKAAITEAQANGRDTTDLAKQDPMDFVKVGQGHFLGLTGVFTMRTLEYGKNKQTNETIRGGRESLIALRPAKPEEVAEAQAKLTGVATPADLEYTTEQVSQLLDIMDGKTPTEYMRGIGRRGLPGEVVSAVTGGRGLDYLKEHGLVTVDADGTVRRVQ